LSRRRVIITINSALIALRNQAAPAGFQKTFGNVLFKAAETADPYPSPKKSPVLKGLLIGSRTPKYTLKNQEKIRTGDISLKMLLL
jgi:hypothetical protein